MRSLSRLMKLLLVTVMVMATLFVGAGSAFAQSNQPPIKVYYDGRLLKFDVEPIIENGVTLVPFRAIFEALGMQVGWDQETKTVTGTKDDLEIKLRVGYAGTSVNGRSGPNLQVAPKVVKGTTLVPLRFVSEVSKHEVLWDGVDRAVYILSGYQLQLTNDLYGTDSFIGLDDLTKHTNIRPDMYHDGQYFYVMWHKPVKFGDFSGTEFYVSIARNGKWEVLSKAFHTQLLIDSKDRHDILFAEGAYYLKNKSSIIKIEPTESGGSRTKTIASSLPKVEGQADSFSIIHTTEGPAVLYRTRFTYEGISTDYLRIYYESSSSFNNYYDVKDVHNVLQTTTEPFRLFNPDTKLIYLFGPSGYRVLDIETGDLWYDKGQDLVVPYDENLLTGSAKIIYNNGRLGVLYRRSGENLYRFAEYNLSRMVLSKSSFTTIEQSHLTYKYLSLHNKSIIFWDTHTYNRKPSIKRVVFTTK